MLLDHMSKGAHICGQVADPVRQRRLSVAVAVLSDSCACLLQRGHQLVTQPRQQHELHGQAQHHQD